MAQSVLPQILASATTQDGVGFQIRKDPRGILAIPGMENALVAIHLGWPALVACRRDGQRFRGTAVHGDIDIIPAYTPARWEMFDGNDSALVLSLPQRLLERAADGVKGCGGRLEIANRFQMRDPELESLGWAIQREMQLEYPSGRLYLDGLAMAMASRLVARHSSAAPQGAPREGGLSGRQLKTVLAFIEEGLTEDLSLEQIAQVAGVSASHVKAQFRKSVGMPIHQYVIQRRVERARTLLADNRLSMADVAQAAGFAHQSHMARHMRRLFGLAPMAIRRLVARASSAS